MRPPTSLQWLVGNPVSALVLMLGAIYLAYLWLVEGAGMGVGLLAIVVGGYAGRCAERVNAYTRWKREWEGIGGRTRQPLRLPSFKSIRIGLAILSWLGMAALALAAGGDPALRVPVILFWIGSAVAVIAKLKPVRGSRGVVRVCIQRPRSSPTVRDAMKNYRPGEVTRSKPLGGRV